MPPQTVIRIRAFDKIQDTINTVFGMRVNWIQQMVVKPDNTHKNEILHAHYLAPYLKPKIRVGIMDFSDCIEISWNPKWKPLNRVNYKNDIYNNSMNGSRMKDTSILIKKSSPTHPNIILLSGDRDAIFFKLGVTNEGSNNRIFSIFGDAIPFDQQKLMHNQIMQQQRQQKLTRSNPGNKSNDVDSILNSSVIMNQSRRRPNNRAPNRGRRNTRVGNNYSANNAWFKPEPNMVNRNKPNNDDDYDYTL